MPWPVCTHLFTGLHRLLLRGRMLRLQLLRQRLRASQLSLQRRLCHGRSGGLRPHLRHPRRRRFGLCLRGCHGTLQLVIAALELGDPLAGGGVRRALLVQRRFGLALLPHTAVGHLLQLVHHLRQARLVLLHKVQLALVGHQLLVALQVGQPLLQRVIDGLQS